MPNSFDLVIFDCDGVLVDSEVIAVDVDKRVLADLGWALDREEIIERFVGKSEANMVTQIEKQLGIKLAADWDSYYKVWYQDAFDRDLRPVSGIFRALEAITVRTCVASSGTHDKMCRTLGKTGLYDIFQGRIFSATEVTHGKPAPDLFLLAALRMGVAPDRCAVVEDSQYGVQAARSAGMHAFGYAGGVTRAEKLAGENATVFTDMAELPQLLLA